MITNLVRVAALSIPGHAGVDPANIAARSLRASGAMALLLGSMDPDKIRIVSCWKSDAMFRYLHAHALPLIQENSVPLPPCTCPSSNSRSRLPDFQT